ncbi:universal stress protein [Pontibacillus halophilus JSM 076056 = DSM 19796]|uniref:Universal stress protein n=1 Tax=Pontibacillus halophilus JSM 076056 = DSM 19796 TaxID=1385510 RepID=A0A0A5GN40_9BACI|nr:universal stress protein [Pontibacillus halophilus]KGX92555.1 universal stress protein [Pontibacillus halophilus JSM 076056 = DSM 19796]
MFNKILLATDGTEHGLETVKRAAHLASIEQDASVTVLYVIDANSSKHDVISQGSIGVDHTRYERVRPIEEQLNFKGVPYTLEMVKGDPSREISDYANRHEYDIVVMGSRGLNAFQEVLLGSVSHKVTREVDCPVMIIK